MKEVVIEKEEKEYKINFQKDNNWFKKRKVKLIRGGTIIKI